MKACKSLTRENQLTIRTCCPSTLARYFGLWRTLAKAKRRRQREQQVQHDFAEEGVLSQVTWLDPNGHPGSASPFPKHTPALAQGYRDPLTQPGAFFFFFSLSSLTTWIIFKLRHPDRHGDQRQRVRGGHWMTGKEIRETGKAGETASGG
jgi:hypothetical protein